MPAEGLIKRLVTALLAISAVAAVLFLTPRMAGAAFLGAIVLIGAWEWGGFLALPAGAKRVGYMLVVATGLTLAWWLAGDSPMPLMLLAAVWWVAAFIMVLRYPVSVPLPLVLLAGLLILVPGWLALAHLHVAYGPQWVMYFFVLIAAADSGAYFSGRAFGQTRLAPHVSPGKTWEGVIGGLLLVAVMAGAGAWWFGMPLVFMLSLGIAVALISIVGDLTMSVFKRNAGLKDSGNLFPGHGGVLDRIDSMAAGAPLFLIGLGWSQQLT
ncbi:MAG: phosphatidate cytidylyltransferase [Gammaproteobacteria bacterium]|nr:phosphatidate cytidylyltransferase [Gammaproteobacteria bacterium]NNF59831.1 phosphatidate cytidylyltransferase [Gammaproteobacteria bacterium]NNM21295.1 phosphatidate cytidylyltransferase [Gammaproteobacteria bacterium]